jgi:hypothetical protein
MSRHQALSEWIGQVSIRLPHLSKPQATVLALWSFGMVLTRSCGITTVAAFIAGLLGKKEDAVRQQLREWCYDADHKVGHRRQALDVGGCFPYLIRWILGWWSPQEKRLALALDATLLHQHFAVLAISVVYRGCAIPVAWKIVHANRKGAWKPHWLQLLQCLEESIPADWLVIVMADRGLYARWLYQRIVQAGWHPFLRVNAQSKCRLPSERQFRWLSTLLPHSGSRWCGQVVCFSKEEHRLQCTLLGWWGEGHQQAWFVVTDLSADVADIAWYSMRSWIECGFKDLKRGGWGWHQTKMTDPARAERLWLAMAVATLWVVSVGGEAEAQLPPSSLNELPPLHVARCNGRNVSARHNGKARLLSCFARGTVVILGALLDGRKLPLGHFLPEPWPNSLSNSTSLILAA